MSSTGSTPRPKSPIARLGAGSTTPSRHSSNRQESNNSPPLQPLPDVDRSPAHSQRSGSTSLFYGSDIVGTRYEASSPSQGGSQTHRTSHRIRADIPNTTAHHRTVRMDNVPDELGEDDAPGTRLFIWGTRICVMDVQRAFKKFLSEFTVNEEENEEEEARTHLVSSNDQMDVDRPFYLKRMLDIFNSDICHLNVNLQHVKLFNDPLYRKIICYPADIIPYLDMTANELFMDIYSKNLRSPIEVRPFNAEKTRNMRGLNPEDIDQLITISGMVTRTSTLIPEMRQGYFECSICKFFVENEVDRGRIEEPTVCSNCSHAHCFQLIHNRSIFMDKQIVKLQESPDDMPAGQTPHTVTLFTHGTLVESVQPGDRVTVTGIFRAQALRVNPRQRTLNSIYRTNIDVLHFYRKDSHRLRQSDDGASLSDDRVAQIISLSKRVDIIERLSMAIAPSIYEHDDIKKGILCLLFGGTRKDDDNHKSKLRSEINMLLCGDPGTAKSQLLQYVFQVVPRAQYTSGKGTSAVGLTASVTRDADTGQLVLQTGALVLADNGVCCIDEFDKMNETVRSVLHEVMEQQTLSIAKAGIICQLNARTSVLAAANPIDSQWNRDKTIIENIQLPHTLLSRFDLIFLLVDPQDELYDRRLANHLVSLYHRSVQEENVEQLDMSLIRDYIAYAKLNVHPQLDDAVAHCLVEKYLSMRKAGAAHGQVTAYPRQLESLIRLSEAHAKIRLSSKVTVADVEGAYRLHREALKQSAVDPATGRVDVNILAAGMSASSRLAVQQMASALEQFLATRSSMTVASKKLQYDFRQHCERTVTREMFEEAVNELVKKDLLVRTGDRIRYVAPSTRSGSQ